MPSIQGSAKTSGASVSSLSWSQTCTGSQRLLIVGIAWAPTSAITSVTYDGMPLVAGVERDAPSGPQGRVLYRLKDPSSGSHTVVVTFAGTVAWAAAASLSLGDVQQTTAVRTEWTNDSGSGGSPNVQVIDSVSGDLIVDCPVSQTAALTVNAAQTAQQQTDNIQSSGFSFGVSTKVATGTSEGMSWAGGTVWATGAQAVIPYPQQNQVITPPAGYLAIKGPQLPESTNRWMAAAGSLVMAGWAAAVLLSVATPAGALTWHSVAPSADRGPSVVSAMGAGAVVWQGLTPTVLVQAPGITTGAGSLVWHGLTPTATIVTVSIPVPAGSIVFKGPARPTINPMMGLGSLVLQGLTPLATVGSGGTSPQINVGAGSVVWHGLTPASFVDRSILVPAGSLVLAGQYVGVAFSPMGVGSLVWQGLIPTLVQTGASTIAMPAGSLVWHGIAPAVMKDQGPQIPAAGALVFLGLAPQTGASTTITPGAGSVLFTGWAPTSGNVTILTPGAGALVFNSQFVTPHLDTVYGLGAGSLVLHGYVAQPTVTVFDPQTALPGAGILTFAGQTPTVTATTTTDIPVGAGSLVLAGTVSTLAINNVPQVGAGTLIFQGQAPESSNLPEPPAGRLVFSGQRVRSVNSGDASPIPPLAYAAGMFFYQSQRRR